MNKQESFREVRVSEGIEKRLQAFDKVERKLSSILTGWRKKLGYIYDISWSNKSFNLLNEISKLDGQCIEVGGPTLDGEMLLTDGVKVMAGKANKRFAVTNITDGLYRVLSESDNKLLFYKEASVDFVSDAGELPLQDDSLALLFESCLPMDVRKKALDDAARVLEVGGVLIWQGAMVGDIEYASSRDLELVAYEWRLPKEVIEKIPKDVDVSDVKNIIGVVWDIISESGESTDSMLPKHLCAPRICFFRKKS